MRELFVAVLVVLLLVVAGANDESVFLEEPSQAVVAENDTAVFRCRVTQGAITWTVNGTSTSSGHNPDIKSDSETPSDGGNPIHNLSIVALSVYNGTTVQCVVFLNPGSINSSTALLLIQGVSHPPRPLTGVTHLTVGPGMSSIFSAPVLFTTTAPTATAPTDGGVSVAPAVVGGIVGVLTVVIVMVVGVIVVVGVVVAVRKRNRKFNMIAGHHGDLPCAAEPGLSHETRLTTDSTVPTLTRVPSPIQTDPTYEEVIPLMQRPPQEAVARIDADSFSPSVTPEECPFKFEKSCDGVNAPEKVVEEGTTGPVYATANPDRRFKAPLPEETKTNYDVVAGMKSADGEHHYAFPNVNTSNKPKPIDETIVAYDTVTHPVPVTVQQVCAAAVTTQGTRLEEVLGKLYPVRGKWRELGAQFKQDEDRVEDIFTKNTMDGSNEAHLEETCLKEVIGNWYMNNDVDHSWVEVVTALEAIDERAVAKEIRETYGIAQLPGTPECEFPQIEGAKSSQPEKTEPPSKQSDGADVPTDQPKDADIPIDQPKDPDIPTDQPKDADIPIDQPEDADVPTDQPEDADDPIDQPEDADDPIDQPEDADDPIDQPEDADVPIDQPEDADVPTDQSGGSGAHKQDQPRATSPSLDDETYQSSSQGPFNEAVHCDSDSEPSTLTTSVGYQGSGNDSSNKKSVYVETAVYSEKSTVNLVLSVVECNDHSEDTQYSSAVAEYAKNGSFEQQNALCVHQCVPGTYTASLKDVARIRLSQPASNDEGKTAVTSPLPGLGKANPGWLALRSIYQDSDNTTEEQKPLNCKKDAGGFDIRNVHPEQRVTEVTSTTYEAFDGHN